MSTTRHHSRPRAHNRRPAAPSGAPNTAPVAAPTAAETAARAATAAASGFNELGVPRDLVDALVAMDRPNPFPVQNLTLAEHQQCLSDCA